MPRSPLLQEARILSLGIDVGTGGSRVVIVDDQGRTIASATQEHKLFRSPEIGWAEQDPADWWRACCSAVHAALTQASLSGDAIACVGLSGQMHGAVLLDQVGQVIRPALLWCDVRSEKQCRDLAARIGHDRLLQLTCNPALPNFTLTKVLWVRKHEPHNWDRVRHILLPKDYVRFCLTGECAIDVADASGTLMLDVANRRWSHELLRDIEIDESLLPTVFESSEICARISQNGAAATGLRSGTPVVAGAGDQAAGAVAMGVVAPGVVSATIGTSGVVFAATDHPALDLKGRLHTFCHAVRDRWHVMGVTQAAGLSLRWFSDQFGTVGEDGRDPYERLIAEAASVRPGCDGLLWTPYLMGERTPHLDPGARAALVGLTASHTRAHVIRAMLEGVAFSLRETFSIFEEIGVPVTRVRLGGGGARSQLWRQIQADVFGMECETVQADEGAAYGAALLAGVGARMWPSVDVACSSVVRVSGTVPPRPEVVSVMNRCYANYRRVYPATKSIFNP